MEEEMWVWKLGFKKRKIFYVNYTITNIKFDDEPICISIGVIKLLYSLFEFVST